MKITTSKIREEYCPYVEQKQNFKNKKTNDNSFVFLAVRESKPRAAVTQPL